MSIFLMMMAVFLVFVFLGIPVSFSIGLSTCLLYTSEEVEEQLQALKVLTRQLGISSDIDAFMTLAFVSLPVIPKLRINTYGVIDVDRQKQVPPSF